MKFSFHTLGCKVNQYETNALIEIVLNQGYDISDENPDILIINTCTVTAVSDKKNLKLIRKVKKENPDAVIAVCGCFAQISPEKLQDADIDIICGTSNRANVIEMCIDSCATKKKYNLTEKTNTLRNFEVLPASVNSGKTRGLIKIQDGCNNFCTYCIIPYARGRSRSMPVSEILKQVDLLNESNIQEITITGIEIASYGLDIGENLVALLELILEKYQKIRFRLGSLEPRVITDEFCEKLSKFNNLCPHFHLSLQSGCDTILKQMNRKYTTSEFFTVCEKLRIYFKTPAITTDLIIGFPGESDDEFNQTIEFIKKCNFSSMHIFPYSVREGTVASKMGNQVSPEIKTLRCKIATDLANEMECEYLTSFLNKPLEIILEDSKNEFISGHSIYNFNVRTNDLTLNKGQKTILTPKEIKNNVLFA